MTVGFAERNDAKRTHIYSMGLRFQRRANLTKVLGLNISGSGVSPSIRTRYGALSAKGFSLRSGIPGLSFRGGFGSGRGKNGGGMALLVVILVSVTIGGFLLIAWNVLRFAFCLIVELVKVVARTFSKPITDGDSDETAHILQFTEDTLPEQYRNAAVHVIKRMVPDGTFVEQGTEVLKLSISGHEVPINAHESGMIEHYKATGDTISFGDQFFSIRAVKLS